MRSCERLRICSELETQLSQRLLRARDFHGEVREIVEGLRALGHDLWSYDESDDLEVWGPDYENNGGPGIILTFRVPAAVEVDWCAKE